MQIRRGHRISARMGARFLGTKILTKFRNKNSKNRYKNRAKLTKFAAIVLKQPPVLWSEATDSTVQSNLQSTVLKQPLEHYAETATRALSLSSHQGFVRKQPNTCRLFSRGETVTLYTSIRTHKNQSFSSNRPSNGKKLCFS